MTRYIIIFFLLFAFHLAKASDTVTIFGVDTCYAGTEIIFNKYSDQISGSETILGKDVVGNDGRFSIGFEINEITFVFSYLGIYKMHLYACPGMKYEIVLPPRQEKEPADLLNPYFDPVVVHLATVSYDKNELNSQIRMFTDTYLPYYNKHITALAERNDFSELDKDIARMEKSFASSQDAYFNDYRRYRYGLLRHLAYQQRSTSISNEYFRNQPVLLNNPAYMELFNQVYDNYLHHIARPSDGQLLGKAIQSGSIDSMRIFLNSNDLLGTGDLPDLVLLKFLYDEFYDDNYSRSTLLRILDAYIAENISQPMTEVAVSIRKEVTRLLIGFAPPSFSLYNRDSVLVSIENFKGKYVYLNFCSCFSYTCLSEFKMLEALYAKHKDILEIVSIIVDNDYNIIDSFLERSKYEWTFLHYGNQSSIIREYDIRAFPTYYLIDRQGKLAMSPAPSPGDEFEARLFQLMRSRGEL